MIVHFADDGEVGGDDPPQLADDQLQLTRDWALDIGQADTRDLLTHVISPWRALSRAVRRRGSGCRPQRPDRRGHAHRPSYPVAPARGQAKSIRPTVPDPRMLAGPARVAGLIPRRR